jgi:chromosome segregation ATPase
MAEETRQAPGTDKLSALKAKLQGQLDGARKRLDEVKKEIDVARDDDKQALAQRRDQLRKRTEAQEQRFQELRNNMKDWQREKVAHTKDAIASWRQKLEVDKFRRRADRAEESAINALYIAMLDADAAEEAVLDAIAATIDFESVNPS